MKILQPLLCRDLCTVSFWVSYLFGQVEKSAELKRVAARDARNGHRQFSAYVCVPPVLLVSPASEALCAG